MSLLGTLHRNDPGNCHLTVNMLVLAAVNTPRLPTMVIKCIFTSSPQILEIYLLLTSDEDHAAEDSLSQRGEAQVYIISQAHHKLALI